MTQFLLSFFQVACLIPTVAGAFYSILCLIAVLYFRSLKSDLSARSFMKWPGVTILKPIRGLEKNQELNLRSACLQDYPEFQVVFSAQENEEPALPLLKRMERAFGSRRVSVVIGDCRMGPNGKIDNLLGAIPYARHDILVISDSDVRLEPDYLKAIVAPLADPEVGCVCTLYKAAHAERWYEKMELLTLNADFIPSVIFASVSGASKFCLGSSLAFRRSGLDEIGGLESLADYLAEDYEIGRRFWNSGKKVAVVPYFVETIVDLKSVSRWWDHQVCWDQKTRAAQPKGFFATVLIRSIPFALFFAAFRFFDASGLMILAAAISVRMITAAVILRWGIGDREGVRGLALLPLRDLVALVTWFLAFTKKTVSWRGAELILAKGGRLAYRGQMS